MDFHSSSTRRVIGLLRITFGSGYSARLRFGPCPVRFVAKPVVEHLLTAPVCFDGIPGLGLPDQGLGLAPFDPLP
jgi:hypothetical protein